MGDNHVDVLGRRVDYISFGRGKRALVMIPGRGEGLKSVKGTRLPTSFAFRQFSKDFTVYMFGRSDDIPHGSTTRDMAEELYLAMKKAGIEKADILGVSQGGMIAQWLAVDHPEAVGRLILRVTSARLTEEYIPTLENWMKMAREGRYSDIMLDTAEKYYTPDYYSKNKLVYGLVTGLVKVKDFTKFITSIKACLGHDCTEKLKDISASTLVIGASEDRIVGP
ncbi:MAG: alpha/beta fold hydrolase, partial [Clostridia bacterium]|nr:alpha/beta fold hydrolase [Clostridia bacterium]